MPPRVPERVPDPRIREDRAVQDFHKNSDKMHRATHEDAYAKAWFDCCRNAFPQSVRKASPDVDLYNVSTYQCSILFNNMGSFNRKGEFRKAEKMDKPISSNKKFKVTNDPQLSLLREFWGNNHAHVILTAEADSLPTDVKELLDDYGVLGCHSSRSNDLSVHARIDSSGYVSLLWESDAILEVKFGKRLETAMTQLSQTRERTAQQLFHQLENVALAVEGNDDSSESTSKSINDVKKRNLVTRSGLSRLRCCVCHIHPPPLGREFLKTVLQKVCHFKIMLLQEMLSPQHTSTVRSKNAKTCIFLQLR